MQPMPGPVTEQLRPSGWWYALGGVLVAAGAVVGIVLFVTAFVGALGKVDGYDRVPVPGSRVLTLPEGEQVLYVECASPSTWCDWPDVAVLDMDGRELPLRTSFTTETYSVDGRYGERMATVDLPRAAAYEVVTSGEPSTLGGTTQVAIGRGVFSDLPGRLAVAFLVAGALGLAGVVALVVVAVRRSRAKRAQQPPPGWGGPAGGGWAPPPWGPPQGPAWGSPPPGAWAPGSAAPPPPGAWGPPPPPAGGPGSWGAPPEPPGGGGWSVPGGGPG